MLKKTPSVTPSLVHGEYGRRAFLRGAAVATTGFSAALLFGCGGSSKDPNVLPAEGDEGPPEVTTIKLIRDYNTCTAPLYIARGFLADEGFDDVQYLPVRRSSEGDAATASGYVDMSMGFAAPAVASIDAGVNLLTLVGIHVGCYEIVADEHIASIRDLEGKTVAFPVADPTDSDRLFAAAILAFVGVTSNLNLKGLDPTYAATVFETGFADAILAYPPVSQQLRTVNVGHVILNSATDPTWSNYHCCLLFTRPEFADEYPVATKRAVRAILRATDLCHTDPERAARLLSDGGFVTNQAYAMETLSMGSYGLWRDYDPEAAMRYYALRLGEAGVISATPDEIIDGHTDWRFLDMLKDEMAYFPPPAKDRSAFAISCGPDGKPLFGPFLGS